MGESWQMPSKEGKYITGLVVNNSMAGRKVEFVPQVRPELLLQYGFACPHNGVYDYLPRPKPRACAAGCTPRLQKCAA